MAHQTWNTALYDGKHNFVSKYGEEVLALLAPQPGENILDVGCGTGDLSAQIAAAGATVTGLESSAEMIARAREKHPALRFIQQDITAFIQPGAFDAAFSNATLHWVANAGGAAAAISAALKPGGRFVAEFGGAGNMRGVTQAVSAALLELTGHAHSHQWYFPTIGEYSALLEAHGFEVNAAWLFDRPTPLDGPDGMRNWITMFAGGMFSGVDESVKAKALDMAEARLFNSHCKDGLWFADYRRIRVVARHQVARKQS